MTGRLISSTDYTWLASDEFGAVRPLAALRDYSTWRIGGPADVLVAPRSIEQLCSLHQELALRKVPWIVIGNGSNLLFDDAGLRGVVIHVGHTLSRIKINGTIVRAEAGIAIPRLGRRLALRGLSGIEHTIGIRGNLGGLVVMNGGSQRRGISENLAFVEAVAPDGSMHTLSTDQCGFTYRASRLQDKGWIVVAATLTLSPADPRAMRRRLLEILRSRRSRFPLTQPNCGSVFTSAPALYESTGPPGRLIEFVGCKGLRIGDAQVSEQHANFIVNRGRASSADVLELIRYIRTSVYQETGICMECEVRRVTPSGDILPAHEPGPPSPRRRALCRQSRQPVPQPGVKGAPTAS